MASLNRVQLIGHLGQDPELRYMPSGVAVCTLRVATTDKRRDRQTNQMVERTEWHAVVVFDRPAETAAEVLKKGSQAFIEGRLQTRKWQDKEGRDRWTTEIIASDWQILGKREAPAAPTHDARTAAAGEQRPEQDKPAPAAVTDALDDNIPF